MATTVGPSLRSDGLVQLVADARDVEDAFGDDGAAHQAAEVGAQVGHHRNQRVAQDVGHDHTRGRDRPLAVAVRT